MRISDDQRREVAANLRLLDDKAQTLIKEQMLRFTIEELAGSTMFGIGLCAAANAAGLAARTLGDSWDILADLIDPTCHIVLKPSESDFSDEPHYLCSRCGKAGIDVYERDDYTLAGIVDHAHHCSYCGARVVRGDGD